MNPTFDLANDEQAVTQNTEMIPLFFKMLPPEVRNKIYDYALTSEGGTLQAHVGSDHGPNAWAFQLTEVDGDQVWNRLKDVNKQLRSETEDLELGLNKILFNDDETNTHQVLRFFEVLRNRDHVSRVRNVEITPPTSFPHSISTADQIIPKGNLTELDKICQQNPNMHIRYNIHAPSSGFILLWQAEIFVRAVRGLEYATPWEPNDRRDSIFAGHIRQWKARNFPHAPLEAGNLRFHLYGVVEHDYRIKSLIWNQQRNEWLNFIDLWIVNGL